MYYLLVLAAAFSALFASAFSALMISFTYVLAALMTERINFFSTGFMCLSGFALTMSQHSMMERPLYSSGMFSGITINDFSINVAINVSPFIFIMRSSTSSAKVILSVFIVVRCSLFVVQYITLFMHWRIIQKNISILSPTSQSHSAHG